jgi:hypothetical protein
LRILSYRIPRMGETFAGFDTSKPTTPLLALRLTRTHQRGFLFD